MLPGDPSVVIRAAEEPALAACKGMTIVTTDGTTLLGADDKAGVAEILEALWRFKEDPARLHGPIRVAFTPDEEVGRGTEHFDVKAFGADLRLHDRRVGRRRARGRDLLRRHGARHGDRRRRPPGLRQGQDGQRPARRWPTSSWRCRSTARRRRPRSARATCTRSTSTGNVSEAKAQFLVRDFTEEGLHELEAIAAGAAAPGSSASTRARRSTVEIKESYRNMKYVLDQHPHVADYAEEAIRRAGPRRRSARRSAAAPTARACRSWACRRRTSSTAA